MNQDTTTESEPTPGPWILTAAKGGEFDNNPRGRIAILEQPPKEGGVNTLALTYDDSPKSVANARLIAAAPDLRDALDHTQGDVKTARAILLDAFNEGLSLEDLEGEVTRAIEVLDQADERTDDALQAAGVDV